MKEVKKNKIVDMAMQNEIVFNSHYCKKMKKKPTCKYNNNVETKYNINDWKFP